MTFRAPSLGALAHVGVLIEPLSVAEKGLHQAFEIQCRLKVWQPRRAAVMGAGNIGLLATLVLHLRGFKVVTCARLLTHPVQGLDNYRELFERLAAPRGAIKVFCQVAE